MWNNFGLCTKNSTGYVSYRIIKMSINNLWFCIWRNQGITLILQLLTELLFAFPGENWKHKRKNMDCQIINISNCKTFKKRLLDVELAILVIYCYKTATTRALYESTDWPSGRSTDNPPNSTGLGDFHWIVPELMVHLYSPSRLPIWHQFGLYSNLNLIWKSGTIANTSHDYDSLSPSAITTNCLSSLHSDGSKLTLGM